MTIDLKKEQTKLVKNLDTVLKAPSMQAVLKSPNLQTILEKQLNILGFLEKKNESKILRSTKFVETYNTSSGKRFALDTNISYKDMNAVADDIGYLGVYIKNIYKVDIDALAEGKDASVPDLTVSDVTPVKQNPMMAAMPFMMPGMNMGGSPDQNPIYNATANMRIQQEAARGKIYLYDKKPKIIIILK